MDKLDYRNLKKRYLIWLYKTTKEQVDKVERKFSQFEVDEMILEHLKKLDGDNTLGSFIEEFQSYVDAKKENGVKLKYDGLELKPEFHFILFKLNAIETVIVKEFGEGTLKEVKLAYEEEMTRRIFAEREEKR